MDVLGNGTQLYSGNTTPTCGNCGTRPVGRDFAGGEIVDEKNGTGIRQDIVK